MHGQGEPVRIVAHLGVDRVGEQARPVHANAKPLDRLPVDLDRRRSLGAVAGEQLRRKPLGVNEDVGHQRSDVLRDRPQVIRSVKPVISPG